MQESSLQQSVRSFHQLLDSGRSVPGTSRRLPIFLTSDKLSRLPSIQVLEFVVSTFTFKALMLCAIVVTLTACTPVPASSPSIDATNPPVFASTMSPVPAATPQPAPTIVSVSTPTPRPTPLPPVTPSPAFTLMPPTMSLSHVDRVYPGFKGSSGWPMPTQRPGAVAWMHGDAIPPNPSFTIAYTSGDTFIVEVTGDGPPESLSVQAEIDHSGGRI